MYIVLPFILYNNSHVWFQKLKRQHIHSTLHCSHLLPSEHSPVAYSTQTVTVLFGHWAEILFHFITCYHTFHSSFHNGRLTFQIHCTQSFLYLCLYSPHSPWNTVFQGLVWELLPSRKMTPTNQPTWILSLAFIVLDMLYHYSLPGLDGDTGESCLSTPITGLL